MSISKRDFLRLGGGAAFALITVASPVTLNLGGSLPLPAMKRAWAKDGNNGNGNGGGNGNGNSGNGGGNGNSGNSGGNGNGGGSGGGNGEGNGNSGGNGGGSGNGGGNSGNSAGGNSTNGSGSSSSATGSSQGSGTKATEASDGSIDVRHANGITETLRGGRYIMKDGKGRTIISRQGTASDARRLSRFFR